MKKAALKIISGISILLFCFLTACGNKDDLAEETSSEEPVTVEILAIEEDKEEEMEQEQLPDLIASYSIGTVGDTYSGILKAVAEEYRRQGYELQVKKYDDYFAPYNDLAAGSLDAVLCSHGQFLKSYNKKNNSSLYIVDEIYYTPYRIYSNKQDNLDAMKSGAKIAIPDDVVGQARSMMMLEEMGYVELRTDVYDLPTYEDVANYLCDMTIEAVAAENLSDALSKYDYVIMDSDSAMAAELDVIDGALYTERADSDALKKYCMVLVAAENSYKNNEEVSEGEESSEDASEEAEEPSETSAGAPLDVLVKTMKSGPVRDYLYSNFHGTIVTCRDRVEVADE